MIHIVTIHHGNAKFIDVQSQYLQTFTEEPYKVWSGQFKCNPKEYKTKHFYIDELKKASGHHHLRMNHLAAKVLNNSNDSDLLVFMDGDAFPIKNWVKDIREHLKTNKIVAVQRAEIGDTFPHPIFLCTTVGFWKQNKLSWDFTYKNVVNCATSGPALEAYLNEHNVPWKALNKTNTIEVHPIFFAVYEYIYHHGDAFREMVTGVDYRRTNWIGGTRFPNYYKVAEINKQYSEFFFQKIKANPLFPQYYFIGEQEPVSK
jgi:hypothetical protein